MATRSKKQYDYDVEKIVGFFEDAMQNIEKELNKFKGEKTLTVAMKESYANQIDLIIDDLQTNGLKWAESSLNASAMDGIAQALYSMKLADTLEDAKAVARLSSINRNLLIAQISDTQNDILAVTKNVDRKAKTSIQRIFAEQLRAQLATGSNSIRQTQNAVYKAIKSEIDTAIIDSAGRRWKTKDYVNMLAQTKAMQAHREANINTGLEEGARYGRISKHGAKDACSKWEGKIVKLTPDAPGDYPYINDLPRREIFHPNCRHILSPVFLDDEEDMKPKSSTKATKKKSASPSKQNAKIKVATGDDVLMKAYGGLKYEKASQLGARAVAERAKKQYKDAESSVLNMILSWEDDNTNPLPLAMEDYYSEKLGLGYKRKSSVKLTAKQKHLADLMQEDAVQRMRDAGYTHVKVYRGVQWNEDDSWLPERTENMTLTGRSLTSWTMRKDVARNYADYVDDAEMDGLPETHGGIIEATIPIDKIAFNAIVGDTDEVVVIGDIHNASLIAKKRAERTWSDER